MIPRYSRPEMVAIWSPETRFRIWFEIEAHACDALAEIGVIPKEAARTIWEKGNAASFDTSKLKENLQALLGDLQKSKPASSKGVYLRKVTVSSTMGPGVPVDQSSLASTAG